MPPGGITQLVECLLCKQNVAGSNPTTSTSYSRISSVLSFFDNWQLEIKENYNSYIETEEVSVRFLAKRIRAHDGCLGIRRRRRTYKAATSLGEPPKGIDPGISEWGNPAAVTGGHRGMNT